MRGISMQQDDELNNEGSDYDYGDLPEQLTPALLRFLMESERLFGFLKYSASLASVMDEHSRITLEALRDGSKGEKRDNYEKRLKDIAAKGAVAAFDFHWQFLRQMAICRYTDNFLCYIADLLGSIYRHRPQTLHSKDLVRVDFVLKHDSMQDLISAIADRKVNELAYQSMEKLNDYILREHGFDLFEDDVVRESVIEIVEIRNLLVHNRGIVSNRFLTRMRGCATPVGKPLDLQESREFEILAILRRCAISIDQRAHSKFDLERSKRSPALR